AYSTTIQSTADYVAENPDVVECFVNASISGWYNYMYGDNSAADALILSDNPDMTQDKIDFAIATMTENGIVDSGDTEELGIGAMTDDRMTSFYEAMVDAGVIEAGLDISASYSLDFVNKGVGLDLKP
ncbi:MAG: ABC transporter substrate-binding protein, partial [Myxococcota bacterium]